MLSEEKSRTIDMYMFKYRNEYPSDVRVIQSSVSNCVKFGLNAGSA